MNRDNGQYPTLWEYKRTTGGDYTTSRDRLPLPLRRVTIGAGKVAR